MDYHLIIIAARKDLVVLIVEGQTEDVGVMLPFHTLGLRLGSKGLLNVPQENTPVITTYNNCINNSKSFSNLICINQ